MRLILLIVLIFSGNLSIMASSVPADIESGAGSKTEQLQRTDSIPFRSESSVISTGLLVKIVIVFFLLMILVVGIVIVMRKMGYGVALPLSLSNRNSDRRIQLIEVKRLSVNATLFLVSVDKTPLLLTQSGDSITVVSKAEWCDNSRSKPVKDSVIDN